MLNYANKIFAYLRLKYYNIIDIHFDYTSMIFF